MTISPVLQWSLALLLAMAFKEFYSLAAPSQLQWLLGPLASLLNSVGGFAFQPTPTGEWLDAGHGLVIVKACAGGNFLIASWLGYLWRWHDRPFNASLVLRAVGVAWLMTLAANAMRILLIAHGQDGLSQITGLADADSHRLIGIGVYLGALWLQLAGTGTALVAPVIYLGIALIVPTLNGWLTGRHGVDMNYVLWTAAVPLAGLLVYGVSRLHFRRCFMRFGR